MSRSRGCGSSTRFCASISGSAGNRSAGFPAMVVREPAHLMVAIMFFPAEKTISAAGSLRTTSTNSLPGITMRPSSSIVAGTSEEMVIAPSEQVTRRPSSVVSKRTPSRMGIVDRGERACVVTDRALTSSLVLRLNRMFRPSLKNDRNIYRSWK